MKSENAYDVDLLRALACETRKKVLIVLLEASTPLSVSDIAIRADVKWGNLSDILATFARTKIIERQRDGKQIFCFVSETLPKRIRALADFFKEG